MEIILIMLLAAVVTEMVLGLVWRWNVSGLMAAAAVIGGTATAIAGDWSQVKFMFADLAHFLWIGFKYCVYCGFIISPVMVSALLTFRLKKSFSLKKPATIPAKP